MSYVVRETEGRITVMCGVTVTAVDVSVEEVE